MSEQQRNNSFQTKIEARQAEARANIANAIWTGLKLMVSVVTLKFLWESFLERGGSQEELMVQRPEDFDSPPESPKSP